MIICETHNALPRLTFQHFLSVMSEGIKLKISLRLSCGNEMDTRNNRDFGGTLTGFVFDGSSAGI
ncbi:hypothetical protein HGI47_22095 [Novosphingobium sp. ERN07]|nr:hypothetical protein [Novosphingobium sp. ERN07]